ILVMEHVPGITLDQLLKANRGRLSTGRVNRLVGQFCDVLQAAHDQGIAHGNLKPDNVIVLEADSPYEKIKIREFGFARLVKPYTISDGWKVMSDESKSKVERGSLNDERQEIRPERSSSIVGPSSSSSLITHHSSLRTPYLSPERIAGGTPTFTGDIY